MATTRPRGSSIFSGTFLIFIGLVLLLHNYRGLEIGGLFTRWWPLIFIIWGAIKLYERTAGARYGTGSRTTGTEIFLIVGLLALVGIVVGEETAQNRWPGLINTDFGNTSSFDLDVPAKTVPADARILVRGRRGDVTVRGSDTAEIRVSGKKNVNSWSESEAQRRADRIGAEIVQNGDGYEVHPTGDPETRSSVDLEVEVPKKARVTIQSAKGDVTVSDMSTPVEIEGKNGDVDVRDTLGDVNVEAHHGDTKISNTTGNVQISGSGGGVEVVNASGSLTLNGEFIGVVRAEKVAKGMRFVSHRTDLTIAQLSGHMETGSGNMEIIDAPGNLSLRTREDDISIENATGKVTVTNSKGNIEVRFSSPPKEDIEITNSSAAITISLPASSSFDILGDCHSCDIDSEFSGDNLRQTNTSGNGHLEGKYGSGRGPKITLKTSYGSISIHKTS
ncbi:MAG TPA: DUF4097 family beta strand repeat-containing protein [Candidatus Acidoferrum sp.]|jgi:hypothetical protein